MADGQDTVRVQDSTGKLWDVPRARLKDALARPGVKLYAGTVTPKATAAPVSGPGPVKRLLTSAAGVPENADTSLEGNIKGAKSLGDLRTWIDALGQGVKGLNPYSGYLGAESAAEKRFRAPGGKIQGALEYILSGVPYAGPSMVESAEKTSEGDIAGGTGAAVRAALLSRAAPSVAKLALSGRVRQLGQFIAGASPEKIEQLQDKSIAAAEEKLKGHAADVKEARGKFTEELGEKRAADVARSKAESGAIAKESVVPSSMRGPVFRRLNALTDQASTEVTSLDEKVRQVQNSRWNAFRAMTGSPTIDWNPVQHAVLEAEQKILKGSPENIQIFRNILAEGTDPDLLKSGISNMGKVTLPFDEARGYYTELGRKIATSTNLPGDVRRALSTVQDAVDAQIKEKIPPSSLRIYSQLKSDWSQYMKDFYDSDGPFTKLKNAATAQDRINILTGKWGKEIMDASPRYGQQPITVQAIRTLNRQIENLPSSVPKPTERPTYTHPEEPNISPFDPVMARRRIIEGHAPGGITPGPFLMYALRRALLNKTLNIPLIKAFLSGEPGGPLLPGGEQP